MLHRNLHFHGQSCLQCLMSTLPHPFCTPVMPKQGLFSVYGTMLVSGPLFMLWFPFLSTWWNHSSRSGSNALLTLPADSPGQPRLFLFLHSQDLAMVPSTLSYRRLVAFCSPSPQQSHKYLEKLSISSIPASPDASYGSNRSRHV